MCRPEADRFVIAHPVRSLGLIKEADLIKKMEEVTQVKGPKLLPMVSGVDIRILPK